MSGNVLNMKATAQRLDLGFLPSPSGAGLYLMQDEDTGVAHVLAVGYRTDNLSLSGERVVGVVKLIQAVQTVFGYPNDEAYEAAGQGLENGIYELTGSTWKAELVTQDESLVGASRWFDPPQLDPLRHFFIGSKDASCSSLARGIAVDVIAGRRMRDVAAEIIRQM